MPLSINLSPLGAQALGLLPDEDKRRREAAARVSSDIQGVMAPQSPPPQMMDLGQPAGPMSTPVQRPGFGEDFMDAGGSPGGLIDFYRQLQPADRDAFADAMEDAEYRILVNGERIEDQLPILHTKLLERFKVGTSQGDLAKAQAQNLLSPEYVKSISQPSFDPSTIKSREDLMKAKALNQIQPDQFDALSGVYPEEKPERPTSVSAFLLADPGEYDRQFGQGSYDATRLRLKEGGQLNEEPGAKPPMTFTQARDEVQQGLTRRVEDLKAKMFKGITEKEYGALSDKEQDEYIKFDQPPYAYIKVDRAMADSAEALQLILNDEEAVNASARRLITDAAGADQVTPEQMVKELKAAGIDAKADHPKLREAYAKMKAEKK